MINMLSHLSGDCSFLLSNKTKYLEKDTLILIFQRDIMFVLSISYLINHFFPCACLIDLFDDVTKSFQNIRFLMWEFRWIDCRIFSSSSSSFFSSLHSEQRSNCSQRCFLFVNSLLHKNLICYFKYILFDFNWLNVLEIYVPHFNWRPKITIK